MYIRRSQIRLSGLKFYAYHGVLHQERTVGAYFILNLTIDTDFSEALSSDKLDATISYADVLATVQDVMRKPSALLEHLAGRICQALFDGFPAAMAIHLDITKQNPPMGADCIGAGVSLDVER